MEKYNNEDMALLSASNLKTLFTRMERLGYIKYTPTTTNDNDSRGQVDRYILEYIDLYKVNPELFDKGTSPLSYDEQTRYIININNTIRRSLEPLIKESHRKEIKYMEEMSKINTLLISLGVLTFVTSLLVILSLTT